MEIIEERSTREWPYIIHVWHLVDFQNMLRTQKYGINTDMIQVIKDWCDDNDILFGGKALSHWLFKTKEDAIAFKLRWG